MIVTLISGFGPSDCVFDWPFVGMNDSVWNFWILFLGSELHTYMFLYVSFCVYLIYKITSFGGF